METVITEEEKGILRLPPVGKILSESVTLYRTHARTIAGIGVLPALLGAMSILLLAGGSTIPSTILLVVAVIVGMFARFAWAASVTSETVLNAGVGAAYRAVFANIRSVAWISILTGLVILGGLVLLVIPGIIVAVKLNFALYAFFIEKKRGSDALATSWYYARNSFWPIVWRLVCLGLILSFIGILVSIVGYLVSQVVPFGGETADFSMVLLRDSQQEISVISQFFQFAFNYFVSLPMSVIYGYILYRHLQTMAPPPDMNSSDILAFKKKIKILAPLSIVALLIATFLAILIPLLIVGVASQGSASVIGLFL